MKIKPIRLSIERHGRAALAIICVMPSVLLSSCGGGGDGSSPAETKNVRMQAQVVTSTGTVPSSWKGRAPKMEVINSIAVPPEPAPAANNATLAGVDVNGNGVRDDVERIIARDFPTRRDNAIKFIINTQLMLTEEDPKKDSAAKLVLKNLCSELDGQTERDLATALLNNQQRILKYRATVNAAGVMIISSDSECGK
jgi:hypothetical protein